MKTGPRVVPSWFEILDDIRGWSVGPYSVEFRAKRWRSSVIVRLDAQYWAPCLFGDSLRKKGNNYSVV